MLHIEIHSFSYKKGGIPKDPTENGGGFAFDCRGIKNPGRIDQYKPLTGNDKAVQEYLENETQFNRFLEAAIDIVSINIETYLARNFQHLMIGFGCTGGQHRSVYSAIKSAKILQEKYPEAHISVHHDEQPQLN